MDIYFLKKFSICFSFLALIHTVLIAKEKPDTLEFIHITDTHICNFHPYHPLFADKRNHFGDGTKPLIDFFEMVNNIKGVDFIVITGDMIDYYEAESINGDMLGTQVEQFVDISEVSNVPIFMTLGNHDIASYWVNSESTYAWNQFNEGKARSTWIRNSSCFKNGIYYSKTYQVDSVTYRLIFLDNGYYDPGRNAEKPPYLIDQTQLLWLDDQLQKSDNDIELIFMHIPPLGGLGEKNSIDRRILDVSTINISDNFIDVLEQNKSVPIIFSGHTHHNAIYEYKFPNDYSLVSVQTGAFGRGHEEGKWRSVKLTGNSIVISYPGKEQSEYILRF